ncbi:MAG: glycoside hydrolase family 3 N-terminal domain-containing protein [Pseudorhodobacter sp.]|nr:glycoside hydrolase family 3 N-terminal domain-containing protein [Pseudorhodobacter sp.]
MSQGAGAAIFGCAGLALGRNEAAFFRDADPFGFILFARNVANPDQLRRLTDDLRAAVSWQAPVLVDQEGGRVQRLRAPDWREWSAPLDQVAGLGLQAAARALWLRYRIIADELRAVGIDGNCAPCVDVATALTHPFLRNRCYGDDPGTVAFLAQAVVAAHLAGGVLPVIKHIPGHGRAVADSHLGLPLVGADAATLETTDFLAFRTLVQAVHPPLAMTAHVIYQALDPAQPATTSSAVIKVIRNQIGFDGLLLSDDLSMQALAGRIGERAAMARAAGCDIALHCNGDPVEMQAVAAAAGRMDPASLVRAQGALAARGAPAAVDIAALIAELSGLQDGQGHG